MQEDPVDKRAVAALEAEAVGRMRAGREREAVDSWGRLLQHDPNHLRALTALGQHSFRKGEWQPARVAFQRVVDVSGADPQQWVNLALVCQRMGDEPGEENAVQGALACEPNDLLALIMRANLFERQGKMHKAARAYGTAAIVAPAMDNLHPDLKPALAHAIEYREKYDREFAAFMDQYLNGHYQARAGENLKRFRDSVDIMLGRKRRYDSQSAIYHYPQLAPIDFFERADFPWLDAFEAATDDIRQEFMGVLGSEQGFEPYISYPNDVPVNQWAELNNSPQWSAFHLFKMGRKVEANAAKCPVTMSLLASAPAPDQPGRTPAAMFSLLKPHTKIPPHVGVSNVRVVTHLPLIIPESCGFRVGNETREWVPGKAWVFDDTINHEAWNDSDKLRVVLIFDIWHPHLTPPERAMITAMTDGINAFSKEEGGFDL
ncbi:MAG: aspartyl/asparaginyl beta-hydroxylase domain-containing protein [Betaproteobacteria bacterium]|nr:aspartyl/asparaginyl beta-hydroxylase domain-containing protein [Betaproteobacteria bacterium]